MEKRNRAILGILLALLLVFGVACTGGSADGEGADVVTDSEEADAATEEVAETESDDAATEGVAETESDDAVVGTRQNPLAVGTTARVGDWEVKVTEVNLSADAAIAAENQFNDPPADGSVYILVGLEASYAGEESGTFWVDMMYSYYGSGGNTFDSAMAVEPNSISDAGETFPGASVTGNLVFEVPIDQVSGGALILEESFSFDETRVFFAVE